jgi:hypothetical protein
VQTDSLKLIFTYLVVLLVVAGGGTELYLTDDTQLQLVLSGFIGSALTFVFSQETAKQATRAAQTSSAAGAEQQSGS